MADAAAPKSLADRVSANDSTQNSEQPSPVDWAEEMNGPSQVDGASEAQMGSALQEPEFDVNVTLNELQSDPNNPLFSGVDSFDALNLPEFLNKSLAALSFSKPSKIQAKALPLLLTNPAQNLIGQSQSGTGKTAAFVLNILSRVDISVMKPQALVLAPSRELARQILGVVQNMAMFMEDLRTFQAVKDETQRGKTCDGHVVVGTPGTVFEMLRRRQMDSSQLKVLVLDEADTMLDQQGLGDQCKRIKGLVPRNVQTVLFSATFNQEVMGFAQVFAPNANRIELPAGEINQGSIKQMYLDVSSHEDKYAALCKFYGLMTIASSIIFVATRATAAELARRMTSEGHQVGMLTGELQGADRDNIIDQFRQGFVKVLITTNVLSRGIDVQSITMVINYDVPLTVQGQPDLETFHHRVGRTGRFGKAGVALTLLSDRRSWEAYKDICNRGSYSPTKLDTDDWDNVERVVKAIIKSTRNVALGGVPKEISMN